MANNITNIYFSNTFGDLVRTSNNIINAWNYLQFQSWDKPSGEFILSSKQGYGFKSNTRAVFYYETLVTGDGYLQVDNNAEVKKTLTLSNTNTQILCLDARGVANINYLNVTNTGLSIVTSGNNIFRKNIDVYDSTFTNKLYANTAEVSYNLKGNTANFTSNVAANNFVSNNYIYVQKDLLSNRDIYAFQNITLGERLIGNKIQANTYVNTQIVSATDFVYGDTIVANSEFITANITANRINCDSIYANTLGEMIDEYPSIDDIYSKNVRSQSVVTETMTVSGGMVLAGDIRYETNEIVLNSNIPTWKLGLPSQFAVNRVWDEDTATMFTANANAALLWSETSKRWRVVDVVNSPSYSNPTYTDILIRTDLSTSTTETSADKIASASSVNAVNIFANSSYSHANAGYSFANSSFNRANNSSNTFIGGTSGTAQPINGTITLNSSNGVVITASSNTITINTPQDVRQSSNVNFNSLGIGPVGTVSGTAGEIRATNQIIAYYSDDRLKTRLGNIENSIEKVLSLNGFYYEANDTAQKLGYEKKREIGISAQEVEKILPEIISPAPIDSDYMTVHYERLIPLLIEAIKDQQKQIEELKNRE